MARSIKGFTLIELLVVIAIIGVLASIGIYYMNSARDRADDANVIAELSMARTAAQLYYDANESYKGTIGGNVANNCNAPHSMFIDAESGMYTYTAESNYPANTDLRCSANDTGYEISASLSNPGEYWCVNYEGLSVKITGSSHLVAHPNNDIDCIP